MSEAANTVPTEQSGDRAAKLVSELRVTGHLMTLDPGLFCVILSPCKGLDQARGLPGVRISPPPGTLGRPELVSIRTFREDGWLSGVGDVATVRVSGAPAQILVTVYQAMDAAEGSAPNLQVVRLDAGADVAPVALPAPADPAAGAPAEPGSGPIVMDMVAHIQTRGDVGAKLGTWLGDAGSKLWIEGFAVAPAHDIAHGDIEYQAVLGRGWLSPWVEGGQYCGSRGMALPVLGLRLRLRGAAAEAYDCTYSATFLDGTAIGPIHAGEPCEAESLAPMESFRIDIYPRGQVSDVKAKVRAGSDKATVGGAAAAAPKAKAAVKAAAKPAAKAAPVAAKPVSKPVAPVAKPAGKKPPVAKAAPAKPSVGKRGLTKPAPSRGPAGKGKVPPSRRR